MNVNKRFSIWATDPDATDLANEYGSSASRVSYTIQKTIPLRSRTQMCLYIGYMSAGERL